MPGAAIAIAAPCGAWGGACPQLRRYVRAAARSALVHGAAASGRAWPAVELAVTLADDAAQRRLNREYRGLDRPTNVLAFPAWEPRMPLPEGAPLLLGDVVLAFETVAGEAAAQGKPLADHLRHLTVHGVLHLLGFDHHTAVEAAVMEALETAILARLGVPDPYRDPM